MDYYNRTSVPITSYVNIENVKLSVIPQPTEMSQKLLIKFRSLNLVFARMSQQIQ